MKAPLLFSFLRPRAIVGLSLILWLNLACTLSQRTQVVERSKRDVPTWVEMEPQLITEGDHTLRMHLARKAMRDLPLAVKQTQLQASSYFRHKLIEAAAESYQQKIDEQDMGSEVLQSFNSILENMTRHELFEQIQVEDIYYETLAGQGPIATDRSTVYNVHVLVRFPVESLGHVEALLRDLLLESDHSQLKKLAQ